MQIYDSVRKGRRSETDEKQTARDASTCGLLLFFDRWLMVLTGGSPQAESLWNLLEKPSRTYSDEGEV